MYIIVLSLQSSNRVLLRLVTIQRVMVENFEKIYSNKKNGATDHTCNFSSL